MLQIRIDQQYARMGLDIQKPFLALNITHPKIELDIQEPRLEIHSPRPRLYIDQSQCFADMDKRTPSQFSRYYADLGMQAALEAIGDIAGEGDMLGHIEKGTTLEEIAATKMDNWVDFNVTAVPKQPPEISWDIRPVEIELIRGQVDLTLDRGIVENNLQWGKVNLYIEQKNYLKLSWYDTKLNQVV
ncbi:MAG TPA: hypothetical protein DD791_02335 [Syntrophomonas sp.]|mgnify:CR=1 FL=1|jgi:hypothetical protein|nr:hypothetical protein [Syntrophomonas sp.]